MASANNPTTDDYWSTLGPPSDTYNYPFNEIQALWQVDSHAAGMGISHGSTLLEDNRRSRINARVARWIYDGEFTGNINLLAVDNVHLHGNALLSVLRTRCGQTDEETCGMDLKFPLLVYVPFSVVIYWGVLVLIALSFGRLVQRIWKRRGKEMQRDMEMCTQYYVYED